MELILAIEVTIFMSCRTNRKARVSPRKVTIQNTAQGLTSQAGLLPVVKFLDKLGADNLLRRHVSLERGNNAVYELTDVIWLSLVAIVGGSRSLVGITTVWSDTVLRKMAGWARIPDSTNLGRIFKTSSLATITQLETVVHVFRGRVWKKVFSAGLLPVALRCQMWIDTDSTVKTVYGEQEGARKGYNPHKRGALSYHPLIAFCAATKEILQGWLRSGDAYTSNGIVEFMRQLLAHLPKAIRIVLRADSGFFGGDLLNFLESLGHGYLIKVKLKGLCDLLAGQDWKPVKGQPGWEQCIFWYRCADWKEERRFVAVRLMVPVENCGKQLQLDFGPTVKYEYFCYVTTEELTGWQAHKKYGQRATCETWIDEAKNQMGLAHIRTDSFLANSALFQCAILAYNTLRWMAMMSGDKTLRSWEVQTIRAFLIRVAGKLLVGGNQLQLKTPPDHLYATQWDAWTALAI